MDRANLGTLSGLLLILGGILVVGSIVVAFRVYGKMPFVRENPEAWIYVIVGTAGGVLAYAGVILGEYLKTGNLRKAIPNWALGFAVVLVVAIGGYLLRR